MQLERKALESDLERTAKPGQTLAEGKCLPRPKYDRNKEKRPKSQQATIDLKKIQKTREISWPHSSSPVSDQLEKLLSIYQKARNSHEN